MPMATARNQPDDLLLQYAVEVIEEIGRRGLEDQLDTLLAQRLADAVKELRG